MVEVPSYWREKAEQFNLLEEFNEFLRIKADFNKKYCFKCKEICCHSTQCDTLLPDSVMDKFRYSYDRIGYACIARTARDRCIVESWKPPVCIRYFCDKRIRNKAFDREVGKAKDFINALIRVVYSQLSILNPDIDTNTRPEAIVCNDIRTWAESHREVTSLLTKHLRSIHIPRIRYPPIRRNPIVEEKEVIEKIIERHTVGYRMINSLTGESYTTIKW